MAELEIEVLSKGENIAMVRLEGFLDAHTFEHLDDLLQGLLEEGIVKIGVNLSGVEYISSAGAGVFIGAMAQAQECSGNIVLISPTESVQDVFDLLGVSQIFTILASDEDAKRLLSE